MSEVKRNGYSFGTKAVHAGLTPDPSYGSVIPAIHQTSTYAQPAPGEFAEDYDYSRSANPTRAALETALGELEGGHGVAFSSGLAAEHAVISACSAAIPEAKALASPPSSSPSATSSARRVGLAERE